MYQYLSQHRVDVISKTANALHSSDEHKFHYFDEGVFLHHICLALLCMHAVFKFKNYLSRPREGQNEGKLTL